jgi:hypothetical protein
MEEEGEGEAGGGGGDFELFGVLTIGVGGGEGLLVDGEGFHVLIEQGDVKAVAFDGDLAMQCFIGSEFEDAAAIGAEFDAFVGSGDGGEEDEEGDEGVFHVRWVLGWV